MPILQHYRVGDHMVDKLPGTVTSAAGAATLNGKRAATVTTEALTTAAGSAYTSTITTDQVAATDIVLANIVGGTSTTGLPILLKVVPAAGSFVVTIQNAHASAALNGTLKYAYQIIKV